MKQFFSVSAWVFILVPALFLFSCQKAQNLAPEIFTAEVAFAQQREGGAPIIVEDKLDVFFTKNAPSCLNASSSCSLANYPVICQTANIAINFETNNCYPTRGNYIICAEEYIGSNCESPESTGVGFLLYQLEEGDYTVNTTEHTLLFDLPTGLEAGKIYRFYILPWKC